MFEIDPLETIARAARTLDERAAGVGEDLSCAHGDVTSTLEAWRRALGEAAPHLEKRLAWDGLAVDRLLEDRPAPPSRWIRTLASLVGRSGEEDPFPLSPRDPLAIGAHSPRCAIVAGVPLAFEDVWIPALAIARRMLIARTATFTVVDREPLALTAAAYASLERDLLSRLSALGARALYRDLQARRPPGEELRLAFLAPRAPRTERYDALVRASHESRWLPLFARYPALARLCATAIDQWVDASAELLERATLDAGELARAFGSGEAARETPRAITALDLGLSDPHEGGRRVAAVCFDDRLRVIYKPRPMAIELAWSSILTWCAARGVPVRPVRCLDRGDYGWQERIEHRPPPLEDAARYYERSGALLAVLHALSAIDCHRENLIASDGYPVLVDAETILHPEPLPPAERERGGDRAPANEPREQLQFLASVVRTGFLPRWLVHREEQHVLDITGLGGTERDQPAILAWRWTAINTDAMSRAPAPVALETAESTIGAEPSAFVEEMTRGFAQAYRILVRDRAQLLAPDGPLLGPATRGAPQRFIFRATLIYAALLERALSPEHLTDGLARSVSLDAVVCAFVGERDRPAAWPIASAERRALEQCDIPCFRVGVDQADLVLRSGVIRGFFAPALEAARARIEAMDEADLAFQLQIIRGSLHARGAFAAQPRAAVEGSLAAGRSSPPAGALTRSELVDEAAAIAGQILACAFPTGELRAGVPGLHWLGIREIQGSRRYQIAPLDDALYDGSAGIALFLAATARATSDARLRDGALVALARVRGRLREPEAARALAAEGAIGGGLGIGSILYAIASIGGLIDEPTLRADLERACATLTDAAIDLDTRLDVLSGAAGAILGLLAAEERLRSGAALERAIACGRHIVRRWASEHGSAPSASAAPAPRARLTGASHGAAGIAYALLRLYERAPIDALVEVAMEAIGYERSLFDDAEQNWPDLREEAAPAGSAGPPARRFACGWCHGAPGIGLSRLGSLAILDDAAVRAEIDAALETTLRSGLGGPDHLCCGAMGKLEILAVGARALGREALWSAAHERAAQVLRRARRAGGYRLPGITVTTTAAATLVPTLFSGLAGIGYELLRLADPDHVPSVLLWR